SHIVVNDPQATRAELASLETSSASNNLNQQAHIKKLRDDELSGTVETPSALPLLLSMPFDYGWSARLVGTPLTLFRADYGLTAALIPAGTHHLTLSYAPPGRALGWWFALGTCCILLVLFAIRRSTANNRPPRRIHSTSAYSDQRHDQNAYTRNVLPVEV